MNQIVDMFTKSNERMARIIKGDYSREQIELEQKEFTEQTRLVNAVISAYAVTSKNARAHKALERLNILDETTSIGIFPNQNDNDLVKCPHLHNPITREACLERSGSQQHYDICRGCDVGKESRRLCNITEAMPVV
jgi:hypothetical protein